MGVLPSSSTRVPIAKLQKPPRKLTICYNASLISSENHNFFAQKFCRLSLLQSNFCIAERALQHCTLLHECSLASLLDSTYLAHLKYLHYRMVAVLLDAIVDRPL